MSVNKYKPHVFLLPEDDANTALANGFVLGIDYLRNIQILPQAGGWASVRETFISEHVRGMRSFDQRLFILMIDFDAQMDRAVAVKKRIPQDIVDRVFIIGARTNPEELSGSGLGSLENIGQTLAQECRNNIRSIWSHDLLKHNKNEVDRLCGAVYKLLFKN